MHEWLVDFDFDFSDNFGSKISAQMQNFTSLHCGGVKLVDGIVGITKERFYKKI